jgi:hypothetical protein
MCTYWLALLVALMDDHPQQPLPQPQAGLEGLAGGLALWFGRGRIADFFTEWRGRGPRYRRMGVWIFGFCGAFGILAGAVSCIQWLVSIA